MIYHVEHTTRLCSPTVVVPKGPSAETVNICVDSTQLNKVVQREIHPMFDVDTSLAMLGEGNFRSKLDANSVFFQIPLAEESKPLTIFLTPVGRFAFHRLPLGLSSSPEVFQKVISRVLDGLEGVKCQLEDVCIWRSSREEHDACLHAALSRVTDAGMTMNPGKSRFKPRDITFLSHVISSHGISVDPGQVAAVQESPRPTSRTRLLSFLGMVTALGRFGTNISTVATPLRELLKKDVAWLWGCPQEEVFVWVKQVLSSSQCLPVYDIQRETSVETDASRVGLGAAMYQIQSDSRARLVAAASRALTGLETRFAVIELEALAVKWACHKFEPYILGKTVTIKTDHKPLVPLLNGIRLDKLPVGIQWVRLSLMRYSYEVVHIPGKANAVVDALSRTGA